MPTVALMANWSLLAFCKPSHDREIISQQIFMSRKKQPGSLSLGSWRQLYKTSNCWMRFLMLRRFLLWTNEKRWKRRWKRKRKNNSSNGCLMTVLKISLGKPIWFSFPPLPQKRLKKIGPPILPRKGLCSFNDYVRPQKSDWDSIGPKRNGQKGAGQRMPRFSIQPFFTEWKYFCFRIYPMLAPEPHSIRLGTFRN